MDRALPLVLAAPMAGGPSTPELCAAVARAGGLGFLAAGYKHPAEVANEVNRTRELGCTDFGINLFVPHVTPPQPEAVASYAEVLRPIAERLGAEVPQPRWDDTDDWEAKLAVLLDLPPVPWVSFTFGCPDVSVVRALQAHGSRVLVTVTDLEEAEAARDALADGVVVQGHEAGGHRGTHTVEREPNRLDHLALLPLVAEAGLPMVAAGGVTTVGDVRHALDAGAVAVAAGTAFLLCPETGTNPAHRAGLVGTREAVQTRDFSGRVARGLANSFTRHTAGRAPACFPQVDQLTKPLRRAASTGADPEWTSLWAGVGWRAAQAEPAERVVRRLLGADA